MGSRITYSLGNGAKKGFISTFEGLFLINEYSEGQKSA